jgi:hypothetical protein
MKTIITPALVAMTFSVGAVASQAQAHTILHFQHKGAPYAVPHEDHQNSVTASQSLWRLGKADSPTGMILAHHKPGYHDCTPNTKSPACPKPKGKARGGSELMPEVLAGSIVVAHHKPPYHDGLPKTSEPNVPQSRLKAKSGADLIQVMPVRLV